MHALILKSESHQLQGKEVAETLNQQRGALLLIMIAASHFFALKIKAQYVAVLCASRAQSILAQV
jgi:hypothetical protein